MTNKPNYRIKKITETEMGHIGLNLINLADSSDLEQCIIHLCRCDTDPDTSRPCRKDCNCDKDCDCDSYACQWHCYADRFSNDP
jgi:hypothetical protein